MAVLALGVPIGAFLLLFTWQNLEVIRLGHEATRLQKQKQEIENANKALQLELDRRTSLAAVEQRAVDARISTHRSARSGDGAATGAPLRPPTPDTRHPEPADADLAKAPPATLRLPRRVGA